MLLVHNSAFADINSRLVFISNQHNQSTGLGTLVLDMIAWSDGGTVEIDAFENGFLVEPIFLSPDFQVAFSEEYFYLEFGGSVNHFYDTHGDYNIDTGEVTFTTIYWEDNPFPTLPNSRKTLGESDQKIVRFTIQYSLVAGVGSISWLPGFSVTDQNGMDITGTREEIPSELIDIPLPVELSSFTATAEGNKVILTWTTQSEINNQGFEVYRSTREDGAYALIASYENNEALQGAGNSNTERSYRYEDRLIAGGETYWYQIADVDYSGVRTFHGPVSAAAPEVVADRYVLHPNYPNPFNPETNIRFEIPANAINSSVKLTVYNNLGMEVRTLINGSVEPGIHSLAWDGRNDSGKLMASGVYFLRLETGTFNQTRKMLLAR